MTGSGVTVIHCIQHPIGAKVFIEPLVQHLCRNGFLAQLWFEQRGGLDKFVESIDVPHRAIRCNLCAHPFANLNALRGLIHAFLQARPAVVHAHQTLSSPLPLFAARIAHVPVRIYHNHGCGYLAYHGVRRVALRWLEAWNIAMATHVLFVSHSTWKAAQEEGLLRTKGGRVLGPGTIAGIDLTHFPASALDEGAKQNARLRFGHADKSFVVGYVGRAVDRKGFPAILEIWASCGLIRHGAQLLLAGCSPRDVTKAIGFLPKGVTALGYEADMISFYAACDTIALPSKAEGFPYSLLEAAASGRSVIATDVPGSRDAVEDGVTGFLTKPGSTADFVEALERLFWNRNLCEEMGSRGRKRVGALFSRETVLDALLDFYQTQLLPGTTLGTR